MPPALPSPLAHQRSNAAATLWRCARPAFLLLTPLCAGLGLAVAWWLPHPPGMALRAALVMLGALAAHAAVNWLNEWQDWRSGLDALTERTPFSGGSGALQVDGASAPAVRAAGMAALALAAACGIALLLLGPNGSAAALLPLGMAGLVLVVAYTPWITRQPWLCLLAPGLGFGPLMVMGSSAALLGHHSSAAAWAASIPLAQVSALLLLNQFPDTHADAQVGRRTLPLHLGKRRAARVFALLHGAAPALLLAAVLLQSLPPLAALGLLTAPLAAWASRQAMHHTTPHTAHHGATGRELLPALRANVLVALATPGLMVLGLALSPHAIT